MTNAAERFNLRKIYIETLIELAGKDDRIVSLDTDSREATLADKFAAVFPERALSFGIAEQDMVTAAAGMATMDMVPFVNSYAMFIAMRGLDQVRNVVAYPNLNVKMVLSHHGLDTGADGVTHQLTEDIAIFRSIPNLQVMQPADRLEMEQMVRYAASTHGPMIIKSGKSGVPDVHADSYEFEYGMPSLISEGERFAVVCNGIMVEKALEAKEQLAAKGIQPRIINLSSLTHVNEEALLRLTQSCSYIFTLEDHSIYGGIGGIVAEIMSSHRPTPVVRLGLGATFAECGPPAKLFAHHKMDASALVTAIEVAATEDVS